MKRAIVELILIMKQITSLAELQELVQAQKKNNKTVGFVPTLGALHNGHMSLITRASKECDFIICSIFVNPTQFDDKEDLKKYPRTIESDLEKLREIDCDICFTPTVDEVYPNGQELKHEYDLGQLENILEGSTRPGHYQGVAQVVHRLLEMVKPDLLFLGQKDYQQVKVLIKMIDQQDLPVGVIMCDIIREDDGLAMSSRNVRLSPDEREVANQLYKTLKACKKEYDSSPLLKLKKWAIANLNVEPLIKVDYISFCDASTLEEIEHWEDAEHIVLLGAIFLGPIRLIDNIIIC